MVSHTSTVACYLGSCDQCYEEQIDIAVAKAKADFRKLWTLDINLADEQGALEAIGNVSWAAVETKNITDAYDVVCERVHKFWLELKENR
jgi:hypothetical protein